MYKEHGISPRMEHYACMVDLLGRSGFLEKAVDFINSLPFAADALVWRTLLGACQVHGNTELGKHTAKKILEQDPNEPAVYVLLSNLYASMSKWEDSTETRKSMKKRNLIKEAGCSWIETENRVHKCTSQSYFYAVVGTSSDDPSIIRDTCNLSVAYSYRRLGDVDSSNPSISSVHQELIRGFRILFLYDFDYDSDGLPFIVRYRRRHLSMDDSIESFLQGHNNFMPIRYSYSEIKQMTKCFNDKLGEGAYGSVFKGKLRSGCFIAVKLLGKSKANGQDFISEDGTIGRIHHVNVVQLIGFYTGGSKRARGRKKTPLRWDTIYEIALGFHDVGLAKLYSTDGSIVSLTAARGTLGYIASELFYKSIDGVSFKADVYSFGMLLMEMVGRKKNVNACVDHSSKIYFPSWIYDRIEQGGDMELGNVSEDWKAREEDDLGCTMMKPVDHPSMSKVLDMLEGEVGLLQIPPKPTFYPLEVSVAEDLGISSSSSDIDISITN
ncbi:hypothetical protein RJ639_021370 [Escallonia herrerae]|uniref:Serine-threonine/tyrosine-protein kinase catalytic domain-containing protein n=1 Tax=Escallonia herrerae TaxID=1293975 RepID=A0AA88V4H2_9ASTE|nr:hypothetical protein RJ639_021370 [Escallonia herrerae]